MSDHDLEYGSTPPGAKYEHTDVDPAIGYKFGLWLTVAMLVSAGIVYGVFVFFDSQQRAANVAAQKYPLAVGVVRTDPTPALQRQPFKDIYTLHAEEAKRLGSYGWVDQAGGVTRLPIDRAIEVMLQRGFPTRQGGDDAANAVVQDSSSGRTTAPR